MPPRAACFQSYRESSQVCGGQGRNLPRYVWTAGPNYDSRGAASVVARLILETKAIKSMPNTYQLAKAAKVTFQGVSIGTYARAQIQEYIEPLTSLKTMN